MTIELHTSISCPCCVLSQSNRRQYFFTLWYCLSQSTRAEHSIQQWSRPRTRFVVGKTGNRLPRIISSNFLHNAGPQFSLLSPFLQVVPMSYEKLSKSHPFQSFTSLQPNGLIGELEQNRKFNVDLFLIKSLVSNTYVSIFKYTHSFEPIEKFTKKSLNKLTHKPICTVPILTQFKRYYF